MQTFSKFSRAHVVRGSETYRFSTTRTLSDFPLLIGKILRRGELRARQKAQRRGLMEKVGAAFGIH
jgi:hypothetical protein